MTDWEADLLAALRNLEGAPGGEGMTTHEVAEKLGVSQTVADRRIRELWQKGLISVSLKQIETRIGRITSVPAYRLKAEKPLP